MMMMMIIMSKKMIKLKIIIVRAITQMRTMTFDSYKLFISLTFRA